jgi:hypothetical protein
VVLGEGSSTNSPNQAFFLFKRKGFNRIGPLRLNKKIGGKIMYNKKNFAKIQLGGFIHVFKKVSKKFQNFYMYLFFLVF